MATLDLRGELKNLINNEVDDNVLLAIKTLQNKTKMNLTLKDKLTVRALKSEEDIIGGDVISLSEVKEKTAKYLSK